MILVKDKFVYGRAFQPQWIPNVYQSKKVLQHIFGRLPGDTLVYNTWADEVKATAKKTQGGRSNAAVSARMEGYRFIDRLGPKGNNHNEFVEWTDAQIHDPSSKIFGWLAGDVKESLRNYANGKVGARTLERWAVTLKNVCPEFLERIAVPIAQTHEVNSTVWIGRSRVGKSTAVSTYARQWLLGRKSISFASSLAASLSLRSAMTSGWARWTLRM